MVILQCLLRLKKDSVEFHAIRMHNKFIKNIELYLFMIHFYTEHIVYIGSLLHKFQSYLRIAESFARLQASTMASSSPFIT
jgi:hypothetical protein